MSDNFKYVAGKNYSLAGSGVSASSTSVTLVSFNDINGNVLAMTDFGTVGFIVLEPKTSKAEIISFTGVTVVGDGTSTLTGVTRGLKAKADYAAGGYGQSHSGGAIAIISNPPQFYDQLSGKTDDETITGIWTFSASPLVPTGGTGTQAANATDIANAISGASGTATNLVAGTTKLSVAAASAPNPIAVGDNDGRVPTQGENDALVGNNTDIAVGTGNKMVTQTGLQHNAEKYAADAGSNDTYVVTLSPVPTSYTNGMVVYFKANTVNTGAATINVNSLGAKTIVKYVNTTLADGDIAAGMFCSLIYDGTNFVLQNPIATIPSANLWKNGSTTHDSSTTGAQTIAHGLGVIPKFIKISCFYAMSGAESSQCFGTYNGTAIANISFHFTLGSNTSTNFTDATNIVSLQGTAAGPSSTTAIPTFDATNITLTWSKSNLPTGTINIMWEAFA